MSYIALLLGHEQGEVGEVAAGAGGVCAVGLQQLAALYGPLARHGALRVVPERAVWTEVVLQLRGGQQTDTHLDSASFGSAE